MNTVCVAALYRFARLPEYASLRQPLLEHMQRLAIKGTLLLAPEGINGTIAGEDAAIDEMLDWMATAPGTAGQLAGIKPHITRTSVMPFRRSKVKLKREIISLGITDLDPACHAGTYVEPEDWNALISEPDVLLVDTRNDYEFAAGTFAGAINPGTRRFRDFPGFVAEHLDPVTHRRVAMFCTGGIRCEKSTALLKQLGFTDVYHLRGGILAYLEQVPASASLWRGNCFVFDERGELNHALQSAAAVPLAYQGNGRQPQRPASP